MGRLPEPGALASPHLRPCGVATPSAARPWSRCGPTSVAPPAFSPTASIGRCRPRPVSSSARVSSSATGRMVRTPSIPRAQWRFAHETPAGTVEPSSEHVWLEGGFEAGAHLPARLRHRPGPRSRPRPPRSARRGGVPAHALPRQSKQPRLPDPHPLRHLTDGSDAAALLESRPQSVRGRQPCLRWLARAHRRRTPRCLQSSLRAALKPDNTVVGPRLSVCRRGDVRSADRARGRAARPIRPPPATCRRSSPPTVPRSTGGATPRSRTSTRRAGTTSPSIP